MLKKKKKEIEMYSGDHHSLYPETIYIYIYILFYSYNVFWYKKEKMIN